MNPKYTFAFKGRSGNLLCPMTAEKNVEYDSNTGMWVEGDGYATDYIPVTSDTFKLVLNNSGAVIYWIVYYGANRQVLGALAYVNNLGINPTTLYPNTKEVRLGLPNTYDIADYYFGKGSTYESWFLNLCNPIWKDLNIDYTKESNQIFFRRKLNGKLTFVREDYDYIMNSNFETKFLIDIYKDNALYWSGSFCKTDCEINVDSKAIIVTPEVEDQYTKILAGLENKQDLIQLAPAYENVKAWKRPIFQFYIAGANKIGCSQMGIYWEQEATPTSYNYNTLHYTYKFNELRSYYFFEIDEASNQNLKGGYFGANKIHVSTWEWRTDCIGYNRNGSASGYKIEYWEIQMDQTLYQYDAYLKDGQGNILYSAGDINFSGFWLVNPNDSSDKIYVTGKWISVWGRVVADTIDEADPSQYELPNPDITDTSGYKYGKPLSNSGTHGFQNFVTASYGFQSDATQWGKYYDEYNSLIGYYKRPSTDYEPISEDSWDGLAIWMDGSKWSLINLQNNYLCKQINFARSYSFADSLRRLLQAVDPDLDFQLTTAYSDLLTNKIEQTLYITPKSNAKKPDFDIPAQKAPTTLKTFLDALRMMFQAYWFVENGKLRIERIDYFMNGGSYTNPANVGRDLTEEVVTRNGKAWAFCSNKYTFDKPNLPERMEFGWMDEVTDIFAGKALVMESPFVSKGNIEQISVVDITSDINIILLRPDSITDDGFAILSCNSSKEVINWNKSTGYYIQNGMLSFDYLQRYYYIYNMPCENVAVENEGRYLGVVSVKKSKISEANFPCGDDPDIQKLVKTLVGNGQFEKLSINLSSRNGKATLKYYPYGI